MVALLVLACAPSEETASEGAVVAKPKVGLVLSLLPNDNSFNDIQYLGLVQAAQTYDIQPLYRQVPSLEPQALAEATQELIQEGCGLIFAAGVGFDVCFPDLARSHPEVRFVYMDGRLAPLPNLFSIEFDQEQGSRLVGYLGALMSRSGRLLFLGGVDLPVIREFLSGFLTGAREARRDVIVEVEFLSQPPDYSGFTDPQKALNLCRRSIARGVDVIYAPAGSSSLGAIQAAREAGVWAIGVDSDQDGLAPGTVLTSMMKRMDRAILQEVDRWLHARDPPPPYQKLGLKEGGVSLSPMTYTRERIPEGVMRRLEELQKRLTAN